jgi:hypothetical protein
MFSLYPSHNLYLVITTFLPHSGIIVESTSKSKVEEKNNENMKKGKKPRTQRISEILPGVMEDIRRRRKPKSFLTRNGQMVKRHE